MKEGFYPSGYHASGNYCVANNSFTGKAIIRNGFCPSVYHASGKYCIEKIVTNNIQKGIYNKRAAPFFKLIPVFVVCFYALTKSVNHTS